MYMSYGTFTKRSREFILYLSVLRRYYNNIIHLWAYEIRQIRDSHDTVQ